MNELEQKAYIFATIFTLANKLQVIGDEFDKNVTTKQWLFMVGVSTFKEAPMISELACFLGYSRQNAKRIAADLKGKGYITIVRDDHDARALRIELTPSCKEYFKRREKKEIDFLEKIFAGFHIESTYDLYKGLANLDKNIKELAKSEEEVNP